MKLHQQMLTDTHWHSIAHSVGCNSGCCLCLLIPPPGQHQSRASPTSAASEGPHTGELQETKQYFIALCGSRAEQALAQAQHQGRAPNPHTSPAKQEGVLQPAGPGAKSPATAATAGRSTSSPHSTAPVTAATAERGQQEGLGQVHARLQSLLQHLPEAAEPAAQDMPSLGSGPAEPDLAPAVDPPVGQTHRQTQSNSPVDPQADQAEDQGVDQADDAPLPTVANTPDSSPKHMQPTESAAREAATVVTDPTTAEAPEAGASSTIPVVCGSVQGIYDTKRGVVVVKGGKATRPNKVETMAGMGDGKTWAETIRVDQGTALAGMSLGKWIKDHRSEARAKSRKSPQAKQRSSPAQRAKHGLSSAVVMADGTVQLDTQGSSKAQSFGAPAMGRVLKHVRTAFSPTCRCCLSCST